MYELIISEKPQAAAKIAKALATGTPRKVREGNVNYFALNHKGREIRVASAVGHLYILGERGGESWKYPVFDTEWKPIYRVNKAASYTADYIRAITKLGKDADEITVAADFDIEGEVIGLNVVRFALGKKDANRMKFSTLTKAELIKSYENKMPTLEWGQANAGETRHTLDWFYGINISRALTTAIKKGTNQFKVLSSGRVQAPSLHFLAQREKKIMAFKSDTYWEVYLDGNSSNIDVRAKHEGDKIFEEDKVKQILEETKGEDGIVSDITKRNFTQAVPKPFDLTSLQMEANNMFSFTPKRTLEIAQSLYIEGVASYPRTSSQKLPKELELDKILDKLKEQPLFREKVEKILEINPKLIPNEGKKVDAAHPAIHPTGEISKKLEPQAQKLYDLICKRFFAVFGEPAKRETNTIKIDINSNIFILKGTRTVERNWHDLYEPYLKFEEVELPVLEKGSPVINKKIEDIEKQTQPPKRYTQASIIKELEKRNLGTKATRSAILDNLYNRGYIVDRSIKVTTLGMEMDAVMEEEVPALVDEKLTRQFEEDMEKIREKTSTPADVLKKAKETLIKILGKIKNNEVELGIKLAKASNLARIEMTTVGKCPNCKDGNLMIRKAKKTGQKFVGCNGYPDCKTIFNIPRVPVVKVIPNEPQEDANGKIFIFAGKSEGNMQKICINDASLNPLEEQKYDEEGMICPTCNEGKMKLRKSFYGEFLGCDNFPKCKTMMKIVSGKVDTTPIVTKDKPKKKATKKKVPAKKKAAVKKKVPIKKKTTTKKKTVKKK